MSDVMRERIHDALCSYQLSNMVCEDMPDLPFPLVDLVSPEGGTIQAGRDELFKLADFIADQITS